MKFKGFFLLVLKLFLYGPVLGQCSEDLFFSEYIEGSGNNKALEIYNGTPASIDLHGYQVEIYFNGSTTAMHIFGLFGELESGHAYVLALDNSTSPEIISRADSLTTFAFQWYNGNDAVVLKKKSTGIFVDMIGEVGVNPGESWLVGAGTTVNNTLVRKSNITSGINDWNIGKEEWEVYPIDYFSDLGNHTYSCIYLSLGATDFKGKADGRKVNLSWEANLDFGREFEIERSEDGYNFYLIGYVILKNQPYESCIFVDYSPLAKTNFYRIRSHSYNGIEEVSDVISIELKSSDYAFGPNPYEDQFKIRFSKSQDFEVRILTIEGKEVLRVQCLNTNEIFLGRNLNSGSYLLEIITIEKIIKKVLIKI